MKKVTIQEIAKELKLSRNTVARALNNSETVAYETRYMVLEKACEMGYQKLSDEMLHEFRARSASMSSGRSILVLAKRELSIFWNKIIMGISEVINQNGNHLRFNFVTEEEEQRLVLPMDFDSTIDGVILTSVFSKAYLTEILNRGLPTVCLDFANALEKNRYPVDIVISEGVESVREMTAHLIAQGMKRIGFIGDIGCRTILDRYTGFMTAMGQAGIAAESECIAIHPVPGRYYQAAEVEKYLDDMSVMPEAIVCANDAIAFLLVKALRARGVRVPQDVAVTGFDNQEELSQVDTFLTTVEVKNTRLGKRLAWQLLFRLEHPELPWETVVVDTNVIYRESSEKVIN